MKNYRAISFSKFINEAYIDDKGKLQDFNFDIDDETAKEWQEKQSKTGDFRDGARVMVTHDFESFLSDEGAENIISDIRGEIIMFTFKYDSKDYVITFNPEEKYAEIVIQQIRNNDVVGLDQIYSGNLDELLSYFSQSGLNLLDQLR